MLPFFRGSHSLSPLSELIILFATSHQLFIISTMALPSNHLHVVDPLGVNSRAVVPATGRRASLRSASASSRASDSRPIVPAPGEGRRSTLRSASANSSANSSAMVLYNPDSYALSSTQPAKKKSKTSGKKGKRVLLRIFNVVSTLLVSSNRILLF